MRGEVCSSLLLENRRLEGENEFSSLLRNLLLLPIDDCVEKLVSAEPVETSSESDSQVSMSGSNSRELS